MSLLFLNKVPSDKATFEQNVKRISYKLGINPNWLMFLIDFESAGSFSSFKTNEYGCIGLIQFCPDISGGNSKKINGVNYTMDKIKSMSEVEQLDLVYDYLVEKQKIGGRFYTFYDLYLAILWPKAIGQNDDYIIATSTNKIFDINGNGTITVGEVKKFLDNLVLKNVPTEYVPEFKKKSSFAKVYQREVYLVILAILLFSILWLVYRQLTM